MKLTRWPLVAALAITLAPPFSALCAADDSEDAAVAPQTAAAEKEPLDGFWPTQRMIENFIQRTSVQIAAQYDLSEEQARYLEESSLKRWPAFLKEHRRELQPLVNRYFEQRLGVEPPTPEEVKAWATDAREMLGAFRDEMYEQQMDFRRVLEPAQKLRFDAELIKFNLGMEVFDARLRAWEDGRYTEKEVWERIPLPRGKETDQRQVAEGASPATQPAEIADALIPVDEWARYVERFIARYDLDEAQIAMAKSILDDLYSRANAYMLRRQNDYDALRSRPLHQRDDAWRKEQRELDQPVVELFNELVVRLDGLLTSAQRQRDARASQQPETTGSGT